MAPRKRVRARARPERRSWQRLLPRGRVLLASFGVLALAGGAYAAARETSVFALERIEVVGGTPRVRAELEAALAPELGRSLVRIGRAELERRAAPIPDLVDIRFDRRFPHTLRVVARAERPVMLLRRGKDGTWLVSARARVMRRLRTPRLSSLPRVWVGARTAVRVGETLPPVDGGLAAAALAPLPTGAFPAGVRTVRQSGRELTLVLRSGMEVRLGDIGDLRLKLAIARRILRLVGAEAASPGYVDVSVPERPVIRGDNPQLST